VARTIGAVIATAGGIVSNPQTYGLLPAVVTHTVGQRAADEQHMNRVMKQGDDFRPLDAQPPGYRADLHADSRSATREWREQRRNSTPRARGHPESLAKTAEDEALDERLVMAGRDRNEHGKADRFPDSSPNALQHSAGFRSTARSPPR